MSHPVVGLDDVVHQRTRLAMMTVLAEVDGAEFGYLRATLSLTDGNLARHLQVLDEAGFVRIAKSGAGRGSKTWVSLTKHGRKALRAEIAALRALVTQFDENEDGDPPAARRRVGTQARSRTAKAQ
jgi:DNA-binding MarR family transcriptional regulator